MEITITNLNQIQGDEFDQKGENICSWPSYIFNELWSIETLFSMMDYKESIKHKVRSGLKLPGHYVHALQKTFVTELNLL